MSNYKRAGTIRAGLRMMAALLLIFSLLPLQQVVAAGPGATITAGKVAGSPGTTVKVPFILMDEPDEGIYAYGIQAEYPSDKLEFVGVEGVLVDLNEDDWNVDHASGWFGVGWIDTSLAAPINQAGVLFTVEFLIKADAAPGIAEIAIDDSAGTLHFADGSGGSLGVVAASNGSVRIAASADVLLTAGTVRGEPGDTARVAVSLDTPLEPVIGYAMTIRYPDAILEVTDVEGGLTELTASDWSADDGELTVAWTKPLSESPIDEAGKLFDIVFAVKAGAPSGTADVEIVADEALLFRTTDDQPLTTDVAEQGAVLVGVYTVAYDGNGHTAGTVPIDSNVYAPDAVVTVYGNTGGLVKSGNQFVGWNTQPDGSGITYRPDDTFVMANTSITLYAQWRTTAIHNPGSNPEADTRVSVLVNGKEEAAGTATTTEVNGRLTTTVSVDEEKLAERLEAEGDRAVITIPVSSAAVVVGELNGRIIKKMESMHAVLELRTDAASYKLPAEQLSIDAIAVSLGIASELQDIILRIEIAEPTEDMVGIVNNSAEGGLTLVAPPLEFTVRAVYGDKEIAVTSFSTYVERTVTIPEGVDPERITTGIVVEADGAVRHVPTKIVTVGGQTHAVINSLTNSVYTVVWHPVSFVDAEGHWAQEAVNDMGSRMVIRGEADGRFEPNREMTRAEFAAVIVRALGLRTDQGAGASFTDVQPDSWYDADIRTAVAYGLIKGFADGAFRPDEKLTREQAMAIVDRAMALTGLPNGDAVSSSAERLAAYKDGGRVAAWARDAAAAVVEAGIVHGRDGGALAPQALVTRAEAASIVRRLLQASDLI